MARGKKLDGVGFISRSSLRYPEKFTYSNTEYVYGDIYANVTCKLHGDVKVNVRTHLYHKLKDGCPVCAEEIRVAASAKGRNEVKKNDFVKNCIIKHNGKYQYLKTVYTRATEKVIVTCPKHGDFPVIASNHLRGADCTDCMRERQRLTDAEIDTKLKNNSTGIIRISNYEGSNKSKMLFRCMHGHEFTGIVSDMVSGRSGCKACSDRDTPIKIGISRRKRMAEEFEGKSKAIHGDKYDYSKVNYINAITNVTITCKLHGDFVQSPANHLSGHGCHDCVESGFNKAKPATFYIFKIDDKYLGFGVTNDFETRRGTHRRTFNKAGFTHELLHTFEMSGERAAEVEKSIKASVEICNLAISGFKTEATHFSNLDIVLNKIKES